MASKQEFLDEFLDKSIQDNVKILPDLLISLKSEKKSIEKQVSHKTRVSTILFVLSCNLQLSGSSGTGNGENVSEWERVARDVQETVDGLEDVRLRCAAVLEIAGRLDASSGGQFLSEETVQFAGRIKKKVTELSQMEKLLKYLQWLKRTKMLRFVGNDKRCPVCVQQISLLASLVPLLLCLLLYFHDHGVAF